MVVCFCCFIYLGCMSCCYLIDLINITSYYIISYHYEMPGKLETGKVENIFCYFSIFFVLVFISCIGFFHFHFHVFFHFANLLSILAFIFFFILVFIFFSYYFSFFRFGFHFFFILVFIFFSFFTCLCHFWRFETFTGKPHLDETSKNRGK